MVSQWNLTYGQKANLLYQEVWQRANLYYMNVVFLSLKNGCFETLTFTRSRKSYISIRPTSTCDELSWRGALPNSFLLNFKINQLKYVSPIYYPKSNDGLYFLEKVDILKVNKIEHFEEKLPWYVMRCDEEGKFLIASLGATK